MVRLCSDSSLISFCSRLMISLVELSLVALSSAEISLVEISLVEISLVEISLVEISLADISIVGISLVLEFVFNSSPLRDFVRECIRSVGFGTGDGSVNRVGSGGAPAAFTVTTSSISLSSEPFSTLGDSFNSKSSDKSESDRLPDMLSPLGSFPGGL